MRRLVLLAAALSAYGQTAAPPPPAVPSQAMADEVRALIAASRAEVAVIVRPLDARASADILSIQPALVFHAASTMKVPVMIELFRQAEAGRLRLDDTIVVTNAFHSMVDGSPYQLSTSEDSDGETYKAIGRPVTYRALCDAMITVSSNLAANNLIEALGAKNIQATVDRLGASGMRVLRGVEDQKAFDAGMNNTTTAEALATLFAAIGRGDAISRGASAAMIDILKRQQLNDGIPAGLPSGVQVAHKTGTITAIHHDAGIVFAAQPYVLVVLVRGIADQKISAKLIADISRTIYERGR